MTALITGASQGLGLEFAKICASKSMDLVLVARRGNVLIAIKEELVQKYGVKILVIESDLSKPNAPGDIYKRLVKEGVHIDILINNAGFATYGLFSELPLKDELEEVRVNVGSLLELTHLFLPAMIERKSGNVLNVASTAAFLPGPYMATYYASKAFVLSFTEALHEELKGTGVSVTALCPGPTKTGFVRRAHLENSRLFKSRLLDAHEVALQGYRGMMNGETIVIVGLRNKVAVWMMRFLPRSVLSAVVRNTQKPVQ